MKLKSNQTRTYDGDGYKKRAACLCFRSESEEEVRRRAGRRRGRRPLPAEAGGARPSGDGVPGLRAGLLGSTQMKFRRNLLRRRRGRKRGGGWRGSGSEPGHSARAGRKGVPACGRGTSVPAPVRERVAAGRRLRLGRVRFSVRPPAWGPGRAVPHLSAQHMCAEAAGHEAQAAPLWPRDRPLLWQVRGLRRDYVWLWGPGG